MFAMTDYTYTGGFSLLRRAGPAAAALALASVYIEHLLQLRAGSVLSLDLASMSSMSRALAWQAAAAAGAALFSAPVIALLGGKLNGRPVTAERLAAAAAGAWRLWLAGLLYVLGTVVGALFLLFPGLLLSVAWVLYGPAVVLAGAGPVRALGLSYRRVRRNWARVVALIAGPFICYGVVYAVGALPSLNAALASAIQAAGHPDSQSALMHTVSTYAAPAWFRWGLMPVLFAFVRLYLFAAVVVAWDKLARE